MAGLLDAIGLRDSLGSGGLLGGLNNMYGGQDRLQGLLLTLGGNPQVGAMLMQQAAQRQAGEQFRQQTGGIFSGSQPQQAAPAGLPMGGPAQPMGRLPSMSSMRPYSEEEMNPLDAAVATPKELAVGVPAPQQFASLIGKAAIDNDLPPQLLAAQIKQESGFNPRAVSPVGASGISQFMPGTAREMGVSDPFNPEQAIPAGAQYLRQNIDRFGGSVPLGLAAYNAGPGRVERSGGDISRLPAETRGYVANITGQAGQQPQQVAQAQQGGLSPRAVQIMNALQIPNLPEGQRRIGEMMLQNELKNTDKWEDIRAPDGSFYQRNRATGEVKVLEKSDVLPEAAMAQKERLARAGKPETNISIDNKAESKFKEKLSEGQAKRWNGYIESGQAAQRKTVDIDNMREISRRIGSQGKLADAKEVFGPYAAAFGLEVDGLSDIQAYSSIIQRMAPQMRAEGSGSTSDIEFKGFVKSLPALVQNPAAREMTLDTMEALNRDEIARGEIATKLATEEVSRTEAEKMLRDLPDPMQSYKDWRKANSTIPGNKGSTGVIDYREFFK